LNIKLEISFMEHCNGVFMLKVLALHFIKLHEVQQRRPYYVFFIFEKINV